MLPIPDEPYFLARPRFYVFDELLQGVWLSSILRILLDRVGEHGDRGIRPAAVDEAEQAALEAWLARQDANSTQAKAA